MDDFFTKEKCDRCKVILVSRIMSWFTDEAICDRCSSEEGDIRKELPQHGFEYEGCDYIPKVGESHGQ